MKLNRLLLLLTLSLFACTTAELNQAKAIALPIAEAAIVAAAAYYGVPPSATQAIELAANSLWGAASVAQAGQPPATGASVTSVGNAIQVNTPVIASPIQTASILTTAAQLAQARVTIK